MSSGCAHLLDRQESRAGKGRLWLGGWRTLVEVPETGLRESQKVFPPSLQPSHGPAEIGLQQGHWAAMEVEGLRGSLPGMLSRGDPVPGGLPCCRPSRSPGCWDVLGARYVPGVSFPHSPLQPCPPALHGFTFLAVSSSSKVLLSGSDPSVTLTPCDQLCHSAALPPPPLLCFLHLEICPGHLPGGGLCRRRRQGQL